MTDRDQYQFSNIVANFSCNMGNRIDLEDMDNHTKEEIYNFYFKRNNSTESEKSEAQLLSIYTFIAVISVLISMIITFLVLHRKFTEIQRIPREETRLMERIQGLENEVRRRRS